MEKENITLEDALDIIESEAGCLEKQDDFYKVKELIYEIKEIFMID